MRLAWLERVFFFALIALIAALAAMQLVWGPGFRRAAERNRVRLIPMPAVRGSILDRNGAPLAEDRLSFSVAVVPQEVRDPDQVLEKLAAEIGRSPEQLKRTFRKGVGAPFAPVVVARDVDRKAAFMLEEGRNDLPGVIVLPAPQRSYALGKASGAVLGYLGLVTSRELQSLQSYGYTVKDWVGKGGIEQLYDAALRGTDGGVQVEVDHRGRLIRQLGLKIPVRGKDIRVTLDAGLQQVCYSALQGRRGAVAVMSLASGDLLAAVSSPGFDPAAFVDPDREDEVSGALTDENRPLFNRVVAAAVPPGSVFKIVTAYAGFVAGKPPADVVYDCPGFFRMGQATFRCWYAPGHGPQDLIQALTHSCNVFFWNWGLAAGPETIASTARLFGYGSLSAVDLPGEAAGFIPDPKWKRARFHEAWFKGETANLAIGQGYLLVTPLQVLRMAAGVATGGKIPQPHLLKAIARQGVGIPPVGTTALNPQALRKIRAGMEAAIASESGTGRLAATPGLSIAGKTGTAQAGKGLSHAWFCGYAPVEQPAWAVVVFVEHGGKGGEVAAAMAGEIFRALRSSELLK
ncbi:MAG: penicillin-binding protein 2 [Candidatus Omnitrophica bacterium]|nr:penicillin-binding protein 2 [Candidatus Omnitrophota bacterium]